MAKRRKKKRIRPTQRDRKITKSSRLLRRPFYFEDRRYIHERKQRKLKFKAKVLYPTVISATKPDKGFGRDRTKHLADRPRDNAYKNVKRLEVCRRRKERREILFSSRSVGKGKKVNNYRRMTKDSKVRC